LLRAEVLIGAWNTQSFAGPPAITTPSASFAVDGNISRDMGQFLSEARWVAIQALEKYR
jgi:hypothetical protein